MRHIDQCDRWAGKRNAADGSLARGVLVPNRHRLVPYPDSPENGTVFEPNQIEHAELKDICIIPSCAPFKAVVRVLDGEAPDMTGIAARIADAQGC